MSHPGITILDGRKDEGPATQARGGQDQGYIGRIEEWVVSTLDDRFRPANEPDWMASLDNFSLAKKQPAKVRDAVANPPTMPGGWARFRLSRRKGIAVVSLTDQALIKEEDLQELTGDLMALVEAGHRRIVLDFFAVERISSWAARTINDAVRRCVEVEGGAVKFSGLGPDVASIFAMMGLDPSVSIYPDTASAVGGIWPDLPDLRPLPVSILAALMRAEHARPSRDPSDRPRRGRLSRFDLDSAGNDDEDQPTMTRARLIIQDGPSMGRPVSIKGPTFVIGRGSGCQLRVGSATVSRSHARIDRRAGRLYLRDLGSTNGTVLNGRTLRNREAELRDGDRIQVGPMTFSLTIGGAIDRPGDAIDDLFRSNDRGLVRFEENYEATEESIDINDLGEEIGLKTEIIEDVLVVTPLATELDDEAEVDGLRAALLSLYSRRQPKRVVINLSHVGHLSGRAIGVLVAHHLRLDRVGGALRVCLANPRVAIVLEQIRLGMLVEYHPTIEDAVIAAWPEPAVATGRA